jgi:hypothetical protein
MESLPSVARRWQLQNRSAASRIEYLRAMPTVRQQQALVRGNYASAVFSLAMFEHACNRGGLSRRHQ